MKKFVDFIMRHIKTVYYYVPPCPVCQSPITGRFIKLQRDAVSEWQTIESLKHGELIQPVQEVPRNNCFCINCGHEWPGIVETKFLSLQEIKKEKEVRLTTDILNKNIEERRERVRSDHSPLKSVKNFIGRI